ncbi:hypothetical protein [Bacillus wiedmannii]|uniref:hypothetical protein n=1 Tax=Bacillus wiedmannii TaxID=1890302 RepID=UPI000BF08FF8|nr:hypothetical protein [Bacillus wiedmannii]PEJ95242.1 hypothetical protein CN690_27820 [Bacillus wiedmannii]
MGTYNFKVKGENDLMVGLHVVEGDEFESIEQIIRKSIIASHDIEVSVQATFLDEEGLKINLDIFVNEQLLGTLVVLDSWKKFIAHEGISFNWYSFPYGKILPAQK